LLDCWRPKGSAIAMAAAGVAARVGGTVLVGIAGAGGGRVAAGGGLETTGIGAGGGGPEERLAGIGTPEVREAGGGGGTALMPGGTMPGGTMPGGTMPGGTMPGGTMPGGATLTDGFGGGGGGFEPAAGSGCLLGWSRARAVSSPTRSKTVVFSSSSSQSMSIGPPAGPCPSMGGVGTAVRSGVGRRPGLVSTSSELMGGSTSFGGAGGGPEPRNVAGAVGMPEADGNGNVLANPPGGGDEGSGNVVAKPRPGGGTGAPLALGLAGGGGRGGLLSAGGVEGAAFRGGGGALLSDGGGGGRLDLPTGSTPAAFIGNAEVGGGGGALLGTGGGGTALRDGGGTEGLLGGKPGAARPAAPRGLAIPSSVFCRGDEDGPPGPTLGRDFFARPSKTSRSEPPLSLMVKFTLSRSD
jgi:hypothetical protein